MEQSILLNKGFDERRGSVLIWIRNLCLRAPFLSRLPSTTPLWFKAVFGFSSASQVITFQHVAPFRGELTSAVISSFPPRGDPEERGKKPERCRYFVTSRTLACLRVCVDVPCALWMSSPHHGFLLVHFRSAPKVPRLEFGCVPGFCSVDIPACQHTAGVCVNRYTVSLCMHPAEKQVSIT